MAQNHTDPDPQHCKFHEYMCVGGPGLLPWPCLHYRQRRLQVRQDRRKLQVRLCSANFI
jgi:hypothetical protein